MSHGLPNARVWRTAVFLRQPKGGARVVPLYLMLKATLAKGVALLVWLWP